MEPRYSTVYIVTYTHEESAPWDGEIAQYRTRSKVDAERFAVGKRCYSGPAQALPLSIPRHAVTKWLRIAA